MPEWWGGSPGLGGWDAGGRESASPVARRLEGLPCVTLLWLNRGQQPGGGGLKHQKVTLSVWRAKVEIRDRQAVPPPEAAGRTRAASPLFLAIFGLYLLPPPDFRLRH